MSNVPPAPEPQGSQPAYQPPAPGASAPPPAYPSASGSYPAAPSDYSTGKPKGPRTLGLIAFVIALVAVVVGSILAYVGASQLGAVTGQYGTYAPDGTYVLDSNGLSDAATQAAGVAGVLSLVAFLVYGVLALWAFIQGIVAIVKNRGRGWGIAALILAVVGGGIVGILYAVGIFAGAAPYLAG